MDKSFSILGAAMVVSYCISWLHNTLKEELARRREDEKMRLILEHVFAMRVAGQINDHAISLIRNGSYAEQLGQLTGQFSPQNITDLLRTISTSTGSVGIANTMTGINEGVVGLSRQQMEEIQQLLSQSDQINREVGRISGNTNNRID